jgi:hypothetical protein
VIISPDEETMKEFYEVLNTAVEKNQVLTDHNVKTDSNVTRNILLMLTVSSFKIKAVTSDLSNEQLGEILAQELNTSLQVHFGQYTTHEVMKSIFTSIAKYNMLGPPST